MVCLLQQGSGQGPTQAFSCCAISLRTHSWNILLFLSAISPPSRPAEPYHHHLHSIYHLGLVFQSFKAPTLSLCWTGSDALHFAVSPHGRHPGDVSSVLFTRHQHRQPFILRPPPGDPRAAFSAGFRTSGRISILNFAATRGRDCPSVVPCPGLSPHFILCHSLRRNLPRLSHPVHTCYFPFSG